MARLESILFVPHRCAVEDAEIRWRPLSYPVPTSHLPQIFWKDGSPWQECNQWFYERATASGISIRTVETNALALHAYAQWLESTGMSWRDFPIRKADRCLIRFRGELIKARDLGRLAPATVTQRMHTVISFYRWLKERALFEPGCAMWTERTATIFFRDSFGFERTLAVKTTDLNIPNRKAIGERLEGGLLPLSTVDRDALLKFAQNNSSQELFLMLTLGFFTGMRIGTLCDLKISTLENATPERASPSLLRIAIGPGASPPVATKFGVTGQILIARQHLEKLLIYSQSIRRLKRQQLAKVENKDLIFLTRFGNPYAQRGSDKSPAINVEMHNLRNLCKRNELQRFQKFHFHQSRCTFATDLAQIATHSGNPENAVALVKEALLHRDEKAALNYIKFIRNCDTKRDLSNAFTRAFLGLLDNHGGEK